MKFGVNTLLWTAGFDQSNLSLLPPIKAAGFDGVEIARFSFDRFPAAAIDAKPTPWDSKPYSARR